jgi:hypothetical protein
VVAVRIELNRHIVCDPGEGNAGLCAAQVLKRRLSHVHMSGHSGGCHKYVVGADEVAALTHGFACDPHRVFIGAPEKLCVGEDAAIERAERVARRRY